MLILGIDTSTKICTCSIYDSEIGLVAETNLYVKKNHSGVVMPIIDNLFKISNFKITDINRIAVAVGPGSFTGVRIALGIAKGLALALKKPLYAVNELDILFSIAKGFTNKKNIISLIDARKERVYYKYMSNYEDDHLINLLEKLDKNEEYIFVGDGAIEYRGIIEKNLKKAIILPRYNSFPRATILCELCLEKEEANIFTLEPDYISKSSAEKQHR